MHPSMIMEYEPDFGPEDVPTSQLEELPPDLADLVTRNTELNRIKTRVGEKLDGELRNMCVLDHIKRAATAQELSKQLEGLSNEEQERLMKEHEEKKCQEAGSRTTA